MSSEEFKKQLKVARAITDKRLAHGLSRTQFAALLRISEEELVSLECGDFWESKEGTERWINETLNS